MRIVSLVMLATAMSATAFAADLSGIWSGQIPGRYGEIEDVSFRFTQSGVTLAGKLYGLNESTPVSEGKVDGDLVTFSIITEQNGGPRTFLYTGKLVGKEMQLERKRIYNPGDPPPKTPQKPQPLILRRVL